MGDRFGKFECLIPRDARQVLQVNVCVRLKSLRFADTMALTKSWSVPSGEFVHWRPVARAERQSRMSATLGRWLASHARISRPCNRPAYQHCPNDVPTVDSSNSAKTLEDFSRFSSTAPRNASGAASASDGRYSESESQRSLSASWSNSLTKAATRDSTSSRASDIASPGRIALRAYRKLTAAIALLCGRTLPWIEAA